MKRYFSPQKAPSESIKLEQLRYPMQCSYKIDGIRATIIDGSPRSTTNTELPSGFAKSFSAYEGFDGELTTVSPTPGRTYNEAMSAVKTIGSMVPLMFHVFDIVLPYGTFYGGRLEELHKRLGLAPNSYITILEQRVVSNEEELLAFEQEALDAGYEGIMIRSRGGYYKMGRCTLREYNIFKLVRHLSAEAQVIGFYEQMENTNEKVISNTGLSKRSSHQANKVGKDTLGGFHCRNLSDSVMFDIGTGKGLDAALRYEIWSHQDEYLNRIARYICKPYGKKDKPRQPIWDGWREKFDISEPDDDEDDTF